jgi:hypothetical protein
MRRQADLVEIRNYFNMTSTQLRNEWNALSDTEKTFFKIAVAHVLDNDL